MPKQTAQTAQLTCSFGSAPAALVVTPSRTCMVENQLAATVMDHVPMMNVATFATCSAPTNPAVVAALGSPVPCVPVTTSPWLPGSPTVMIDNQIALNSTSKLLCTYLGVISITTPGQVKEDIP